MSAYRAGLVLSVGQLINTNVDLTTVVSKPKTSLRRLCPEHKNPLNQLLWCHPGEHEVDFRDFVSGVKEGDSWRVVQPEERPSKAASDRIEFTPVPKEAFQANVLYGEAFYYCQPSSEASDSTWNVMLGLVDKFSFVGHGNMRKGQEKMWSMEKFRGFLVLRDVTFPEYIKEPPEKKETEVDQATLDMAKAYAEQVSKDMENIDWTDKSSAQFREWIQSGSLTEPTTTGGNDDLKEALRQVLSQ